MKIAIKAHPTRGKEIISLLESLGGIKGNLKGNRTLFTYYISEDNIIRFGMPPQGYKVYTLEEFEKEFPFKIGDEVIFPVTRGWLSGKIIGLDYAENQLKYKIHDRIGGYSYVEPHKLSLYPMKKERNITLTLDKAQEWYKKGGDLKQVALQAFTEKELNPLPRSWEEYCRKYGCVCLSTRYTNISLKYDALLKLEQLRDCWRNGWVPNWSDRSEKWCIALCGNELSVSITTIIPRFLTFPTREMAKEFLEYFRDLIEKAGDLI